MQNNLEQAVRELASILHMPEFTGKNVPVCKAAKALGKSEQAVRVGLQCRVLPIGVAIPSKNKKGKNMYQYSISQKKLWEYTGILVAGEDTQEDA